jgi:hypothetical protein
LLAWLAGVGIQLHERSLLAPSAYVAACASAALLLAAAVLWRHLA